MGHQHGLSYESDSRKLTIALILIISFMLAEVAVGLAANSLALLSDAAHMLTDAVAIGLSIIAIRIARKPAKGLWTFGFKRIEILSAQFNGITLLLLAVIILIEAVQRLFNPPEVAGGLILAVALIGILVNIVIVWVLASANRQSLNVEGSFQHLLTDLYAFIGTAVAAVIILLTGFNQADSIASLLVAGLMLRSAYGLLKASGRVLMEAAPKGFDPDQIGREIAEITDVIEVHDLHIWEITSEFPSLSAHIMVNVDSDCHQLRRVIENMLQDRFQLHHTTLQVDHIPAKRTLIQLTDNRPQI